MDMEVYDIYMDDEISGTTFDRPEFERMMSDMRAGKDQLHCRKGFVPLG